MSFTNLPIPTHIAEISPRPVLLVHGEKAHSRYLSETAYAAAAELKELMIIPGAIHADLHDQVEIIAFEAHAPSPNSALACFGSPEEDIAPCARMVNS